MNKTIKTGLMVVGGIAVVMFAAGFMGKRKAAETASPTPSKPEERPSDNAKDTTTANSYDPTKFGYNPGAKPPDIKISSGPIPTEVNPDSKTVFTAFDGGLTLSKIPRR